MKKPRHHTILISLVSYCFLLVGCGTRYAATTSPTVVGAPIYEGGCSVGDSWISEQLLLSTSIPYRHVADGEISLGRNSFSSRVDIFVDRNMGVMLSARPLPFVEAARLYVSSTHVALYDLIHETKSSYSYSELSRQLGVEVSYPMLRDLLLGEVSYLGESTYTVEGRSLRVDLSSRGKQAMLSYQVNDLCKLVAIDMDAEQQSSSKAYFKATYTRTADARLSAIHLTVKSSQLKTPVSLTLNISKTRDMSVQESQKFLAEPRSGYQDLPIEQMLQAF